MEPTQQNNHSRGAVLVTGASSGIGLATACLLFKQGHKVFPCVRSSSRAEELRDAFPGMEPLVLDVSDTTSITAAFQDLHGKLNGRLLTGLVNNAGIAMQGPLETMSGTALLRQFEVNVFGVAAVIQQALPFLRDARRDGHLVTIVNVGSIGGRFAIPFNGAYNASKFALSGFTSSLRQELRPWDIRVCLLEPGTTKTGIWKKVGHSIQEASAGSQDSGLYSQMLESYGASVQKMQRRGIPADRVARKIAKLLQARRPAHRSLVGDARSLAILSRLPSAFTDWLLASLLGLPGRGTLPCTRPGSSR